MVVEVEVMLMKILMRSAITGRFFTSLGFVPRDGQSGRSTTINECKLCTCVHVCILCTCGPHNLLPRGNILRAAFIGTHLLKRAATFQGW